MMLKQDLILQITNQTDHYLTRKKIIVLTEAE